jgi:hypothetical protein
MCYITSLLFNKISSYLKPPGMQSFSNWSDLSAIEVFIYIYIFISSLCNNSGSNFYVCRIRRLMYDILHQFKIEAMIIFEKYLYYFLGVGLFLGFVRTVRIDVLNILKYVIDINHCLALCMFRIYMSNLVLSNGHFSNGLLYLRSI